MKPVYVPTVSVARPNKETITKLRRKKGAH